MPGCCCCCCCCCALVTGAEGPQKRPSWWQNSLAKSGPNSSATQLSERREHEDKKVCFVHFGWPFQALPQKHALFWGVGGKREGGKGWARTISLSRPAAAAIFGIVLVLLRKMQFCKGGLTKRQRRTLLDHWKSAAVFYAVVFGNENNRLESADFLFCFLPVGVKQKGFFSSSSDLEKGHRLSWPLAAEPRLEWNHRCGLQDKLYRQQASID